MSQPRAAGETGIDTAGYACLQRLLLHEVGFVLEPGKEYLVETRLHALAQSQGLPAVSALLGCLETDRESGLLHRRVVEAMLNYETSFFRDHHPFLALREVVLPKVIAQRAASRKLKIWCAAVASGQEAYSVAMLLAEHFPHLAQWELAVYASDVSEFMLKRAKDGIFTQIEVNRGLPAAYLIKYFDREGADWRLHDRIRRMVEFSRVNLANPWPSLPQMDVILLRNVLIYLSNDAKSSILNNVARCLRPDGYLFVGGGETMLGIDHAFEPVHVGKAVCYQFRG